MEKSLRDETKQIINCLLVPHKRGLPLHKLINAWKAQLDSPLPFRQMGYSSELELLSSMPDSVTAVHENGVTYYHAVVKPSTQHIVEMVKGQRTPCIKKKTPTYSQPLVRLQPKNLNGSPAPWSYAGGNVAVRKTPLHLDVQRPLPVFSNYKSDDWCDRLPQSSTKETLQPGTNVDEEWDVMVNQSAEFRSLRRRVPGFGGPSNGSGNSNVVSAPGNGWGAKNPPLPVKPGLPRTFSTEDKPGCSIEAERKQSKTPITIDTAGAAVVTASAPWSPVGAGLHPEERDWPSDSPQQLKSVVVAGVTSESDDEFGSPRSSVGEAKVSAGVADAIEQVAKLSVAQAPQVQMTRSAPAKMQGSVSGTSVTSSRPAGNIAIRSKIEACESTFDKGMDLEERSLPAHFGARRPKVRDTWTVELEMLVQELPERLTPEGDLDYMFIIVGEVFSPSKFFWFLKTNRRAIEDLSDQMTEFYTVNADYEISRNELFLGMYVAVLYEDGLWYRGRITAFRKSKIDVLFIDYGTALLVEKDRLRHLHIRYTQLPIQAFRSRLHGIDPASGYDWPIAVSKRFLDMVKGSKPFAAAIVFVEEARPCTKNVEMMDTYVLSLVDTSTADDIHICDLLVQEGLAKPNSDHWIRGEQPKEDVDVGSAAESVPLSAGASRSSGSSPQPTVPAMPQPTVPVVQHESVVRGGSLAGGSQGAVGAERPSNAASGSRARVAEQVHTLKPVTASAMNSRGLFTHPTGLLGPPPSSQFLVPPIPQQRSFADPARVFAAHGSYMAGFPVQPPPVMSQAMDRLLVPMHPPGSSSFGANSFAALNLRPSLNFQTYAMQQEIMSPSFGIQQRQLPQMYPPYPWQNHTELLHTPQQPAPLQNAPTLQPEAKERPSGLVRPVDVGDGRRYYVFELDGKRLISTKDLALLLRRWSDDSLLNSDLAAKGLSKWAVDVCLANYEDILFECFDCEVPWIESAAGGGIIDGFTAYPLKYVPIILHKLGMRDPMFEVSVAKNRSG